MTAATAKKIDLPQEELDLLFSNLSGHDRDHLAFALADLIREDVVDLVAVNELLNNWLMTVAVRSHPDFEPQVKEYRRLVETGEIFLGMDLDDETIRELQAKALT